MCACAKFKLGDVLQMCVKGNIGAGKTTLLRILEEDLKIAVKEEPVKLWRETRMANGDNLLNAMYKGTEEDVFLFQFGAAGELTSRTCCSFAYIFVRRLAAVMSRAMGGPPPARVNWCGAPLKLLERSVLSDKIFKDIGTRSGRISEAKSHIYGARFFLVNRGKIRCQLFCVRVCDLMVAWCRRVAQLHLGSHGGGKNLRHVVS